MRPMTLWEAGFGAGTVSWSALVASGELPLVEPVGFGLRDWAEIIARGGWPATVGAQVDDALDWPGS
jgi:hypothetical protein